MDLLCRAQKLRHQDIPELTAKVEKLDVEATEHLQASMAAQDDHRAAQEAQQVPHSEMSTSSRNLRIVCWHDSINSNPPIGCALLCHCQRLHRA